MPRTREQRVLLAVLTDEYLTTKVLGQRAGLTPRQVAGVARTLASKGEAERELTTGRWRRARRR